MSSSNESEIRNGDAEEHESGWWLGKKRTGAVTGAYQLRGMAEHGVDEVVHTIRDEVS